MATIILSGVGGSSNWLPFMLPLVAIILLLQFSETIMHFIKKKRHRQHVDNIHLPANNTDRHSEE